MQRARDHRGIIAAVRAGAVCAGCSVSRFAHRRPSGNAWSLAWAVHPLSPDGADPAHPWPEGGVFMILKDFRDCHGKSFRIMDRGGAWAELGRVGSAGEAQGEDGARAGGVVVG